MTASAEVLDAWDEKIIHLYGGYDRSPVAATAVQIRREMPLTQSLMRQGGFSPATTTRLHRVNGRLGALMAACQHDLDDRPGAVAAFSEAFYHASEARDRPLQGWIRCWQSSLARKNGDSTRAAVLARDAVRWSGSASPVAARAAVIEARAMAALGRKWQVHERVGLAWRILGGLSDEQHGDPGFAVETMHSATLAEMSAAAYIDVGHPDMAGVYADAALMDLDLSGATGRRSLIRVSAGTAALWRGDVDQAVSLVNEALDISMHRPTAPITARTAQFVRDARASVGQTAVIEDLEDRLRTWALPPV